MKDKYEARPFTPNRVEIGGMINKEELIARLSYELQIPKKYGLRIVKAYNKVINDALEHGEGFNFSTVTLRLAEHTTRCHSNGYTKGAKRRSMYKYRTSTTKHGKDVLEKLTQEHYHDL